MTRKSIRLSNISLQMMMLLVLMNFLLVLPVKALDFSNLDLEESPLSLSIAASMYSANTNGSQLSIGQYGIENVVIAHQQSNARNSISLLQIGSENIANIIQEGTENAIFLQQLGSHSVTDITQQGNGNTANIVLGNEQSLRVHQIGNNMMVDITQY